MPEGNEYPLGVENRNHGRTSAVMLFNGGIETVNDCRR